MDTENLLENLSKNEEEKINKEEYFEIEIPLSLYEYLSSEHCNVQNMCRICLSTDSEVLYPLIATKENSILAQMFMALTALQLLPDDGLPTSICELCQTQVVQCYEFKVKCEKSDCMLKSILKGEFIIKEELSNHSMAVNEEANTGNNVNENNNIHGDNNLNISYNDNFKDELDLLEDVQYLEDLSDNTSDNDALCIVQNAERMKKKKDYDGYTESGSHLVPKPGTNGTKKQKSFSCSICSKIFFKATTFHAHVKSTHPNMKHPHSCGQCKESFNSDHDLKVHSAVHSKGRPWKCNICQKEFDSRSSLRRHISRHMETKRYSCDTCGKSFTEMYALRRHVRVHTGEHVEKKHACNICDKRYSESGLLAAHIARHNGLRPCECSICGKKFSSKRLLASHQMVHTDRKPYACQFCDKRFRHESTRNIHHRTHTGEKPYVCSVCGKNFIQNSNLTLHMRTHTGERPYSCSICDRKFSSGSTLKSHERVHSGERPCTCNYCGKRFTRKSLSSHIRQHTGDRPFECSICSKKFTKPAQLRDHNRVHTGEKPFDCTICAQKFATKSQVLKHAKSHQKSKRKINKGQPLPAPNPRLSPENRGLVFVRHMEPVPVITDRIMFNKEHGELITVNEKVDTIQSPENEAKELTLNIVQEVPLEVTGELVLQDDNKVKTELLVVDNSQNNYEGDNNICLNTESVNIIEDNVNYASDVNLVTLNEGGVSISTSNLEGTTVKLYQLDQSLVQIHSSGGQVTISKITSKMTANF